MKAGWKTSTLGETCEMYQPQTISGKEMLEDGAHPVFGANGVIGRYDKFNHEEPQLLITCRGATCGSVNISEPKSWITGNAMVVRPKNGSIEMRFLEYLFRGGLDISKAITGAAQPQITRTNLAPLEITYPIAVEEQRRIVGILNEAFDGIATATANAEKNFQNTKELFNNYLQGVFTNKCKDWKIKQLADVAEYFNGLTYSPKDVSNKGIIVLRSSNVQNDELDFSDIVRVNRPVKEKLMVKDGDILMCSRNGSKRLVGKTAGIQNLKEAMTFGTFMMIIRSQYNPYLTWFFKSNEFRMQISRGENTMINQITRYMLDDISISFPPPEEQKSIVKKIDALSVETQRLSSLCERKVAALEALKMSLLHQAFNGAL